MTGAFERLDRVLTGVTVTLLAALVVTVTLQVLGRYVPFIPRPLWMQEVARFLLTWMVFLGAAVMLRRQEHFVMDMIPQRVERRLGRLLQVVVVAAVATVSLVLLVGGAVMTAGGLTRVSTASGLHLAWAFAAVPVGALCMLIFSAETGIKVVRGAPAPGKEER
jgi:TRAP-type transport system small permease protein